LVECPENYVVIVREILKFWPKTKVSKMLILTAILVDYVPKLGEDDLRTYLPTFLRLIAENVNSVCPRLAEVSYSVFLSMEFDDLMIQHTEVVLEILIPGVRKSMIEHWEGSIRERGVLCMALMEKLDSELFNRFSKKDELSETEDARRATWAQILSGTAVSDDTSVEPKIPESSAAPMCAGDHE
jgi:hypothetical protein